MSYATCDWSCQTCGQRGTVRVWKRPEQTRKQPAIEHAMDTRRRCVAGCLYTAEPVRRVAKALARG